MKYLSTRDKTLRFRAAEAIQMGLSRDGEYVLWPFAGWITGRGRPL